MAASSRTEAAEDILDEDTAAVADDDVFLPRLAADPAEPDDADNGGSVRRRTRRGSSRRRTRP